VLVPHNTTAGGAGLLIATRLSSTFITIIARYELGGILIGDTVPNIAAVAQSLLYITRFTDRLHLFEQHRRC
jgi:hypothetical protein